MNYVVIVLLVIISVLFARLAFLRGAHARDIEELDEEYGEKLQEKAVKNAEACETKERMETGDDRRDFDTSLDIMSECANRNR